MTTRTTDTALVGHTAQIVAAYIGHNPLTPNDVPGLIHAVYTSLAGIGANAGAAVTGQQPAVPIKSSVHPEYIICLEDGKRMKMIKRYLRTRYGMSPEDYRRKWSLPADYPMVAPEYAKVRSAFAKKIGLGTTRTSGKRRRRG